MEKNKKKLRTPRSASLKSRVSGSSSQSMIGPKTERK